MRPMSPVTVESVCGRITSGWLWREALMRGGHRPRREEVHARPAHRRDDDSEHEIRGEPSRVDGDHPLTRAVVVEPTHDDHEQEGQAEHDADRDEVVRKE